MVGVGKTKAEAFAPALIQLELLPSAMISPRRAIVMPLGRRWRRSGCLSRRTLRRTRHLPRLILRTAFFDPPVRLPILVRTLVHLTGSAILIRTIGVLTIC